jgi:hypothetical protein
MGQDFGYGYGEFAGIRVPGNFIIIPFQDMSQG